MLLSRLSRRATINPRNRVCARDRYSIVESRAIKFDTAECSTTAPKCTASIGRRARSEREGKPRDLMARVRRRRRSQLNPAVRLKLAADLESSRG